MAFAGAQANSLPNTTTGFRNKSVSVTGLTLIARAGAPAAGVGDTGILVTGTPGANQNAIPDGFGPGPANWSASDLANLVVEVDTQDSTADATAAHVYLFSRALAGGNITLTFHNRGAGAAGAGVIRINMYLPADD
jgi:hypothetical protein